MSWVSIDKDKCNNCGVCALRCPRCFRKGEDDIAAYADENNCNLCGHCVALCPTDAIIHEKVDMDNFVQIEKNAAFETDEFIRFIRERRSHRLFKNKEIARKDLERLVDVCRYAPTGGNAQMVEIMVIQDPEKKQKLSDLTIDFFADMGEEAEKRLQEKRTEGNEESENLQTLQLAVHYRDLLLMARQVGYDAIFHRAPTIIVFHSSAEASRTPKDDCVIASTTMGLTARTMGLESTYIGLFEAAAKTYGPLIEELGLPEGHEVYSVLIIGYPKLKFLRTVDRKPIRTTWI